jgi:hypothetical protein
MPTNAALASVLQRPLSALVLVLQQPPSPVSPYSHHTATLVTDPAITALAAINPSRYATIPTAKALASYATTSVAIILVSYICNSGTSEKLWRQRLASFAGFARKSLAISPHHIIGVIKLIYYIPP